MALSWYQRSRSNPYAYHTTSGQYARAPLWPLPLPASLPRWEVVLVSAPSASAGAAGTVGAVFVSFAGPRPLLTPPTGPATRPLPRHPPSRFLQVQKPGFYAGLGPDRDTSTCTADMYIIFCGQKYLIQKDDHRDTLRIPCTSSSFVSAIDSAYTNIAVRAVDAVRERVESHPLVSPHLW